MNWQTLLLLMLVALARIILGAVGLPYVGLLEGAAQALGVLRQPRSPTPVNSRTAASQPTDRHEHDEHEGHTHEEHTSEQGAAPHAHSHDEPGPAATTGAAPSKADTQSKTPSTPATAKGARASKPDAHGHKDDAHKHGTEQPRQATAKGAHAAKKDP